MLLLLVNWCLQNGCPFYPSKVRLHYFYQAYITDLVLKLKILSGGFSQDRLVYVIAESYRYVYLLKPNQPVFVNPVIKL